jgi:hypothetical protein
MATRHYPVLCPSRHWQRTGTATSHLHVIHMQLGFKHVNNDPTSFRPPDQTMKIPVFVSCPTSLSKDQEANRGIVCDMLASLNLEPRALGRTDYPANFPLREVLVIARHCAGGVILGFNQFTATAGTWKPRTKDESPLAGTAKFPTAWNHLETGILFSLGRPLLVFREDGISGGVFDPGVTDVFVHKMPNPKGNKGELREVFLKWRDKVGSVYYA